MYDQSGDAMWGTNRSMQQDMTHKCPKCDQKFMTSALQVLHMREVHSAFVESAQLKIDAAKIGVSVKSLQAMQQHKSTGDFTQNAICPFCKYDCMTKKKLMRHLEVEHKGEDEEEDEPEVKVIQVADDRKRRILNSFRNETSSSSSSRDPALVQNLLEAFENDKKSQALRMSANSLRLTEKRYKCFWCEASFRKRGKLMDHIDMFHKANLQATEVEAEMLHGGPFATQMFEERPMVKLAYSGANSTSQNIVRPPASVQVAPVTSAIPATITSQPQPRAQPRTAVKRRSITTPAFDPPPEKVPRLKQLCPFTLLGSLIEVHRTRLHSPEPPRPQNCVFVVRSKLVSKIDTKTTQVKSVPSIANSHAVRERNQNRCIADTSVSFSTPPQLLSNSVRLPVPPPQPSPHQSPILPPAVYPFFGGMQQLRIPISLYGAQMALLRPVHSELFHTDSSVMGEMLRRQRPISRNFDPDAPLDLTVRHF